VRKRISDDAFAGSFEELPVILVVLVAISLFSVSLAHASTSRGESDAREKLQQDCLTFSALVRSSEALGAGNSPGTYDMVCLANLSVSDFLAEFNSTSLGFEYLVTIQCIDLDKGNISLSRDIMSSEIPLGGIVAAHHTCVNVDNGGRVGMARLTVSIWRPSS
jgi:hypothetical protein